MGFGRRALPPEPFCKSFKAKWNCSGVGSFWSQCDQICDHFSCTATFRHYDRTVYGFEPLVARCVSLNAQHRGFDEAPLLFGKRRFLKMVPEHGSAPWSPDSKSGILLTGRLGKPPIQTYYSNSTYGAHERRRGFWWPGLLVARATKARALRARDRRTECDGYQSRRRRMRWVIPNRCRATMLVCTII